MLIEIDDNVADMHIEALRLGDNPEVLARRILGYWYLQGYNRGKAEGMKLAEERLARLETLVKELDARVENIAEVAS